ncbi:patatin-like protein 3 [Hordeum vulgare subsp. vulgare]|uniref:Patatin n=1 Tax=Hordeum vulgare subsp. vulgare TaxID=112509 RepID=A0A8I6Y2I3_HORVV|nr:patatin-like protein 3 [Hordeum vulgare subsp. vulgare]
MEQAPAGPAAAMDVDKLTYEIFSILESKFLFGYDDPKLLFAGGSPHTPPAAAKDTPPRVQAGKVCILSIDGGGRAADGLLAGAALVRLEASLRRRTGDPKARLADFFDVAAGSGAGGVLAAMLVARGKDDARPLYSAEDALAFLVRSLRRGWSSSSGSLRALLRRPAGGAAFRKVFGDLTLRDTARPVLVPCYDLATGGPFLFSRADAVENPAYDFRLRDVCAATCAGSDRSSSAVEVRSCDGSTRIVAVGGGVALGNPTAAAITHVLNNKREFPLASGVEDLLVISIGSGEGEQRPAAGTGGASTSEIVRIAAEGVSDMVDQAVAMAFGHNRTSNYTRIQAMGSPRGGRCAAAAAKGCVAAEEMLSQKNVESVLFCGKKLAEQTNAEKLERFAHELVKERDRRGSSALGAAAPAVVKQQAAAAAGDAAPASYSNLVSQMFTSIL